MRGLMMIVLAGLLATPGEAGTLVAARTLRAQTVLGIDDLLVTPNETPGALTDPRDAIGLETRVAIYPGRPIRQGDLASPALVERNQMISLVFRRGSLSIQTEGRALDRGAAGDPIRVMNAASKAVVSATVGPDGSAYVVDR